MNVELLWRVSTLSKWELSIAVRFLNAIIMKISVCVGLNKCIE